MLLDCEAPFVYSACGAPCEKQCALQGQRDLCLGVRECTPGCYWHEFRKSILLCYILLLKHPFHMSCDDNFCSVVWPSLGASSFIDCKKSSLIAAFSRTENSCLLGPIASKSSLHILYESGQT